MDSSHSTERRTGSVIVALERSLWSSIGIIPKTRGDGRVIELGRKAIGYWKCNNYKGFAICELLRIANVFATLNDF